MSAKINAKRLLKLADYLETVPTAHFDMSRWKIDYECGFSGCAIGWAAHGKLFKGLELRRTDDIFQRFQPYYRAKGMPRAKSSFGAVAALFQISQDEVVDLFTERSEAGPYDTPLIVAKRIRKFVRENEKAGA